MKHVKLILILLGFPVPQNQQYILPFPLEGNLVQLDSYSYHLREKASLDIIEHMTWDDFAIISNFYKTQSLHESRLRIRQILHKFCLRQFRYRKLGITFEVEDNNTLRVLSSQYDLITNDIISKVADLEDLSEFNNFIQIRPNTPVILTVWRSSTNETFTITIQPRLVNPNKYDYFRNDFRSQINHTKSYFEKQWSYYFFDEPPNVWPEVWPTILED